MGDDRILLLQNVGLKRNNINILDNISMCIERGKIYVVVGDHGSGKTSLCKILDGSQRFSSGIINYRGVSYTSQNFKEYRKLSISLVSQTQQLLNNFSVAHNLLIPDMLDNSFFFKKNKTVEKARYFLEKYGVDISPSELLKDLSLSDKQLIYILRILIRDPELIVLDASFEALTARAAGLVKGILKRERDSGKPIVYFSNRIEYLDFFANNVIILRQGKIIWNSSIKDIDRINLLKMCYTEISKDESRFTSDQEIYELFKFNEAIIHNLPINIIIIGKKNEVRLYNQSAKLFFSLPDLEKERSCSIEDVFGEKNREVWFQVQELLKSETVKDIYNIKLSSGNEVFTLNIKSFPVKDSSSTIGHMLIIQDITRQEKLREQFILSEKLASVGLLAAGVAHEINNPLEIVYNLISYLKFNIKNRDHLQILDELEDEISLIKQIISNLISFSDTQKVVSEQFDVNELIERLISLIKFNARKRKIEIVFKQQDKAALVANKNEIKQVLLNLFRNSMDAMPDGGVINVETECVEADEGQILKIRVRDSGSGIDEAVINNIFLPFYSTKKQGKNMGLGLSVSYGIIEKYGGQIAVKNLVNGGCEFTLIFELSRE